MGKIDEANFRRFLYAGGGENPPPAELSPASSADGRAEIFDNPDAYKENLFFESGRYRQTSLFTRNNRAAENNAVGGAAQISADSTPAELLRDPRVRAMLDAIAYAEGTGNNYGRVVYGTVIGARDSNAPFDRSLVGRRNVVVNDFRHHPNLLVRWAEGQPPSSAAGRYQFLYNTWRGLNMPDFSPRSQDLGAIKLMQRRGMIEPLLRGDFAAAVNAGSGEWASLPKADGNGTYPGQRARRLGDLREVYTNALRRYQGTEQTPPAPSSPNASVVLSRNDRGGGVETLQNNLIRLDLMTEAQKRTGVGVFGPRTEAAVKDFQRNVRLDESGRFDVATQRAMNQILSGDVKKDARGETVRALQENLVRLGYLTRSQVNTGPGVFGPRTDAALREFQKDNGLTRDGIFGPKSFAALQTARGRTNNNNAPSEAEPPPTGERVREYRRWNVYSTGERPARLADGYEDLQPHHDYQTVDYVMRGLRLERRLEAQDIVLTHPGQSNFGQAVPSPLAGTVLFAGDEGDGYGNKVVVRNESTGQIMMIGHLESVGVRRGQIVGYGQNLGEQGSSGNSTGAHIHINADRSVIRRWVADLADGKFDGVRERFDTGRRP